MTINILAIIAAALVVGVVAGRWIWIKKEKILQMMGWME